MKLEVWQKTVLVLLAAGLVYYLVTHYNSAESALESAWETATGQEDTMTPGKVEASETLGDNEEFGGVKGIGSRAPGASHPRDQLKADELLPKDVDTKWSEVNPRSQGDISDQNFLDAGHHIGVNTIGQSLRNANLSIRSEPANPQKSVSPWMNTTIGPDLGRRPLEVGCDN